MAAPPVIAATTLASTTSSVYERVAQTTLAAAAAAASRPQVIADVCNAKGALYSPHTTECTFCVSAIGYGLRANGGEGMPLDVAHGR